MTDYLLKNLLVIQYSPRVSGKRVSGRRLSTFMYVEEGSYRYHSEHVDFVIEEGDSVYVPEGAVYEYTVLSDKTRVIQVEFSFEGYGEKALRTFAEHPTPLKKTENNLRPIFLEMLNNYFTNEYATVASVYRLISVFTERKNSYGVGRIEPALRYIEKNYREKIYVSALAQMCDLSESHLRRLFNEIVGMSPIGYKNSLMLKAACNMLRSERLSVTETAEALGFEDIYTFSQFFKKEMGVSPKKYAELSR